MIETSDTSMYCVASSALDVKSYSSSSSAARFLFADGREDVGEDAGGAADPRREKMYFLASSLPATAWASVMQWNTFVHSAHKNNNEHVEPERSNNQKRKKEKKKKKKIAYAS